MNEKAQWQNRTGLLFKSTSPAFPAVCSSTAGREQGLHQGCSVDRANKSRPMTCWIAPFEEHASSVGMKRNWGGPSFECGAARGRWEVRAGESDSICFHGYWPGMETSLLWRIGSHAPTKEMSCILRAAGPGRSLHRPGTFSARL